MLLGEEVLAAQSMFYFKPPGARGQALHQDNFYLRVEPGTCVAAWIAFEPIDRDNGGLEVVPGTHRMDLFCPEEADAGVSFAREYVPPPPGLATVPVDMAPGDVLFFNGSLVHGSQPNRSADRFRRSFIGHYVGRSAERIGHFYRTISMDGDRVRLRESEGRGRAVRSSGRRRRRTDGGARSASTDLGGLGQHREPGSYGAQPAPYVLGLRVQPAPARRDLGPSRDRGAAVGQ